jgi:SAM-dependent methyltransferase
MYKNHSVCRACGFGGKVGASGSKLATNNYRLIEVFSLGVQPLSNDFRKEDEERSGYAPLKVLVCPNCGLAQLSVVVNPHVLYDHYVYVTSPTQTMRRHFATLMGDLRREAPEAKTVLEIGSNDGALLEFLKEEGYNASGVDPAENLCAIANEKGLKTRCGLFSKDFGWELSDIVIARHVFCHVDDWKGFIEGLEKSAHNQTVIALETPYVRKLLQNGEFDTIYHEHTSYFSVGALVKALEGTKLRLYKVIQYPIHGGAILSLICHKDDPRPTDPMVNQMIQSERTLVDEWRSLQGRQQNLVRDLTALVKDRTGAGWRVAALGASAKSTVWINACGFTRKEIAFIADTTKQKWFKNAPGSEIPVVDEGALLRELPDYVVCFAWNFRDEVLEKHTMLREKGVKFVFPIPQIEIV